jgi:hypothetical protein
LPEEDRSEPEDALVEKASKLADPAVEKMVTQTEARCAAIAKQYSEKLKAVNRKMAPLREKLDSRNIKETGRRLTQRELDKLADQADTLRNKKSELQQLERHKVHEALGKESPYVFHEGELILASKLAAIKAQERAEEEQLEAERPLHATPRVAADEYIKLLWRRGIVREAVFLAERNDLITGCINIGQATDWPDRVRSLHYQVQYVSKGGFAMERQGYVIVFKDKNGLWYVSTDTLMETLHF